MNNNQYRPTKFDQAVTRIEASNQLIDAHVANSRENTTGSGKGQLARRAAIGLAVGGLMFGAVDLGLKGNDKVQQAKTEQYQPIANSVAQQAAANEASSIAQQQITAEQAGSIVVAPTEAAQPQPLQQLPEDSQTHVQ